MSARAALLVLLAAFGGGLSRLPAESPRPPDPPRLPAPRPPTPAEFAAITAEVRALGGTTGHTPASWYGGFPPAWAIELDRVTADRIDRLPDPEFDYTLRLTITRDVPRGTLARLGRLRNLRALHLTLFNMSFHRPESETIPLDPAGLVAELAVVPRLESLALNDDTRTGGGDAVIAVLPRLGMLRRVSGLAGVTASGLEGLARMPALEGIGLGGTGVTDAGLARLARLPRLTGLVLQNCPALTAAAFRPFTRSPRLTTLSFTVRAASVGVTAELAEIDTLETLAIDSYPDGLLTPADIRPFGRLKRLKRLLNHGPIVGDAELEALSGCSALEFLHAGHPADLTDAGLRHVRRMRALRILMLGTERVTDAGLADVATLPRLETLNLVLGPGVSDAGLDALAAVPTLAGLIATGKEGTVRVTEAGLRRFVAARGPRLDLLAVYGIPVADEFVTHLAARAPNLRSLTLGSSPGVTDRGVPALLTLPRLRVLDLRGTSIRPETRPQLEAAWPGARVDVPGRPRPPEPKLP